MNILAIESSCDETAAAIVRDGREILSSRVYSQVNIHRAHGGVVPEIASRRHVESLVSLTRGALRDAALKKNDIDAIAVTYAPGLIGALLTGLNFAKGLAYALGIDLIPVHHLRAHIAANYLAFPELTPPFALLIVSGGHTIIADVEDYTTIRVLGSTRDDAAGEIFDKIAREAGLGYPGGAALDRLATGDPKKYHIPLPHYDDAPYDLSFSGIKTSVVNLLHNLNQRGEAPDIPSLAAGLNHALADMLVPRAVMACREFERTVLCAAGGVAANSHLRTVLEEQAAAAGITLYVPPLALCGDNAAMVGSQGYYEAITGVKAPLDQNAFANFPIDQHQRIV